MVWCDGVCWKYDIQGIGSPQAFGGAEQGLGVVVVVQDGVQDQCQMVWLRLGGADRSTRLSH